MANLEGKREVLIDFPVDFIINTKGQLQAALNAFVRHLDHVS